MKMNRFTLLAVLAVALVALPLWAAPESDQQAAEDLAVAAEETAQNCIDVSQFKLVNAFDDAFPQDPDDPKPAQKECEYTASNVRTSATCTDCPVANGDTLCGVSCTKDADCPGTTNGVVFACPSGGDCSTTMTLKGCNC